MAVVAVRRAGVSASLGSVSVITVPSARASSGSRSSSRANARSPRSPARTVYAGVTFVASALALVTSRNTPAWRAISRSTLYTVEVPPVHVTCRGARHSASAFHAPSASTSTIEVPPLRTRRTAVIQHRRPNAYSAPSVVTQPGSNAISPPGASAAGALPIA